MLGQTFGDGMGWPLALAAVVIGIVLLVKRNDAQHTAVEPWYAPEGPVPAAGDPTATGTATAVLPEQPVGASYAAQQPPNRMPPPRTPDPRKRGPVLFWMTAATIVLGWGVLGMFDVTGSDVPPSGYLALAVAITGGALLLSSVWGRGGGLIALGLASTLALGVTSAAGLIDSDPVTVTPRR